MKATINNPEFLYSYMVRTGANFVVDRNPSDKKMRRIREIIKKNLKKVCS